MKAVRSVFAALAIAVAGSVWAYQVTGPVLEVTDTKIVVQKGKEKWEIARTPDTKDNGKLKVGSQVTVEYSMTAKSVDVKEVKAKK
jgi:cytochrome c1